MKRSLVWTAAAIAALLVVTTVWHALAQPAQGGGPPGAGGFGGMMMAGWPPAPTPVMVATEGIIYVACDGKLIAYDAKTLKPLGEAVYWERAEPQQ